MKDEHFTRLENMYLKAKSQNLLYDSINIEIREGEAEVSLPVSEKYFHALNAVHGSVYFKLLDDAAFFAVNSLVADVFVLTTNFSLQLLKPVNSGIIRASGKARFTSKNLFVGDAELYNEQGELLAYGTGNFARSKINLTETIGYKL